MTKRVELFRILLGPEKSTQTESFESAIKLIQSNGVLDTDPDVEFVFEYMTIAVIVKLGWTSQDCLLWFQGARYVIINGHPLQNDFGPDWDHLDYLEKLRSLFEEKGSQYVFPPANAIRGAFSQNKWEIYEALHQ